MRPIHYLNLLVWVVLFTVFWNISFSSPFKAPVPAPQKYAPSTGIFAPSNLEINEKKTVQDVDVAAFTQQIFSLTEYKDLFFFSDDLIDVSFPENMAERPEFYVSYDMKDGGSVLTVVFNTVTSGKSNFVEDVYYYNPQLENHSRPMEILKNLQILGFQGVRFEKQKDRFYFLTAEPDWQIILGSSKTLHGWNRNESEGNVFYQFKKRK